MQWTVTAQRFTADQSGKVSVSGEYSATDGDIYSTCTHFQGSGTIPGAGGRAGRADVRQ